MSLYAFANVAQSQTDAVLVPAVQGFRIQVRKFAVSCGATATDVTFNSKPATSAVGVAIASTKHYGVNGGEIRQSDDEDPWFETKVGEALTATTGAGSTCGIDVVYRLASGKG